MKELEVTAAGGGGEKPNCGLCLDATKLCDARQAGQPGGVMVPSTVVGVDEV